MAVRHCQLQSCPWIAILVMATVTGTVAGLTVYDCQDDAVNITAIDLTKPAACPDPVREFHDPVVKRIQILQTGEDIPMAGLRCRITRSAKAQACGYDSLTYGGRTTAWQKEIEVEPAACRKILKGYSSDLETPQRSYRGLRIGTPRVDTYFSHGSVDEKGNCEVAAFTAMDGTYWPKAYEQVSDHVLVEEVSGYYNPTTGMIRFKDVIVPFKDQVLRDALLGTVVWSSAEPSCGERVNAVYNGRAKTYYKRETNVPNLENGGYSDEEGAVVIVESPETEQFAGLIVKKRLTLCDNHCYSTQANSIVVCFLRPNDQPINLGKFKGSLSSGQQELASQLHYLHLSTGLDNRAKMATIYQHLCRIERQTLFGKLHDIAGNQNKYALLDLVGPGHTIYTAGGVAYLVKCPAKEAVRVDYHNCTEEIPCQLLERIRFADPLNFILQDFPTITVCNEQMPVRWKVGEQWYCSTPKVQACEDPTALATTVDPDDFKSKSLGTGLGQTMFTPEQQAARRQFIRVKDARGPVQQETAFHGVVNSDSDGNLGVAIGGSAMDQLKGIVYSHLNPLPWMGYLYELFLGTVIAIAILKYIIECLIRTWTIYRRRGCGRWMIASLWGGLFNALFLPVQIAREAVNTLKRSHRDDDSEDNEGVFLKNMGPIEAEPPIYRRKAGGIMRQPYDSPVGGCRKKVTINDGNLTLTGMTMRSGSDDSPLLHDRVFRATDEVEEGIDSATSNHRAGNSTVP